MEPLLSQTEPNLTIFPIKFPEIWEFYQKQRASFWTPSEVDLAYDKFEELSEKEQHLIKYVLAFFAASDGIVNWNLDFNFSQEINIPEVKANYHFQMMIEDIHSEMYAILLDTYIRDSKEKEFLFNAIKHVPCIKKKADWAFKWINSQGTVSLGKRLVAFAIVEGIYFSGAFCVIFYFASKNKLPGLCKSNEFIARDESMHQDFACILYKHIQNKLTQEEVHAMVEEAVGIEEDFIKDAIKFPLIGMNSSSMIEYIKFVADRLLVSLGYTKLYNTRNPFKFMEHIGLEGKNNFFEDRTSEYQKATIMNKSNTSEFVSMDDF